MSPNETWEIVLKDDLSGGEAGGGASTAMGKDLAQKSPEDKRTWQDVGKVAGSLAGVASVLAIVVGAIHRSKIFTTFMDAFLTIMSALADLLLMPLVPILAPLLGWFWKTMRPVIEGLSKDLAEFIKDPWKGIQNAFGKFGTALETIAQIFGGGPNSALGVIGTNASTILKVAGNEIAEHGKKMWEILMDKAIPWADKLSMIWEQLKQMWTDFSNNPTVQAAWKEIWTTIGQWFKDNIIDPLRQQFEYLTKSYLPELFDWVFTKWLPITMEKMIYERLPDWAKTAAQWTGYAGPGQIPNAPTYQGPAWSGIGTATAGEKTYGSGGNAPVTVAPSEIKVTVTLDENKTVESISAAVKKDPLAGWKKAAQYGATW